MNTDTDHPVWWNSIGRLTYRVPDHIGTELTFTTQSAHLKISKASRRKDEWDVRWIIFGTGQRRVDGYLLLSQDELAAAFGLPHEKEVNNKGYAAKYGAEEAVQGRFIRQGPYLNIPCPGTGLKGDPNISVKIYNSMKERVASFIKEMVARPTVH